MVEFIVFPSLLKKSAILHIFSHFSWARGGTKLSATPTPMSIAYIYFGDTKIYIYIPF